MKDISMFQGIMETENGYRFECIKNGPTFVYHLVDGAWLKIGTLPKHYKSVGAAYRAAKEARIIREVV